MNALRAHWATHIGWRLLLGVCLLAPWTVGHAQPMNGDAAPQEATSAGIEDETAAMDIESAAASASTPDTAPVTSEVDIAAQTYRMKCAGCHTIGGGPLSGPDLQGTKDWPANNLADAIRRMEQYVGPIPDEEVDILTRLLQSGDARERLDAEQQRVMQQAAETLEPASAEIGEGLFHGRLPLRNGGLSCVACHEVAGRGGNLAMDLTDVYARMGEAPLISAIENANFPVMREAYAERPVTPQEAAHMTAYLKTAEDKSPPALSPPVHLAATVLAAVLFFGMCFGHARKVKTSTRAAVIKRAVERKQS